MYVLLLLSLADLITNEENEEDADEEERLEGAMIDVAMETEEDEFDENVPFETVNNGEASYYCANSLIWLWLKRIHSS